MKKPDFEKVTVIGAGTMGAGIAGLFAAAGCETSMVDVDDERVENGLALLDRSYEAQRKAGRLSEGHAEEGRARVKISLDLEEACDGAEFLVEAVSENLPLKRELFERFDALCPGDALLTSNTSGLSISEIASATSEAAESARLRCWDTATADTAEVSAVLSLSSVPSAALSWRRSSSISSWSSRRAR